MKQAIVDSHVHFWQPNYLQYDWLANLPALHKPFLPEDLAQAAAGVPLEKMVFVQCDCVPEQGLKEVEWVTELARAEPRLQGLVAFAPLEQGERVRAYLHNLMGYPLVKGVRRLIQAEAAGFCLQPDFIRGVQLLPQFGYSFDLCVFHFQLAEVIKLVEQCPQVSFVLDHLGKPGVKDHLWQPWHEQIKILAGFAHVFCKISGLVTEADLANWSRDDLKPYIDHVLESFGPDRVMYGGDWPVSTLATTYQGWFETLTWATAGLTDEAKQKLFADNAASFYRLT